MATASLQSPTLQPSMHLNQRQPNIEILDVESREKNGVELEVDVCRRLHIY